MKALPSSSDVLEELAAKVEIEIEKMAVSSFRTALDEMVDFHRFLLFSYVSKDKEGNVFSFAQMGYWRAIHKEWLSEYRNLFERAVAKISREEDTANDFIRSLMHAIYRLLPSKHETASSEVTAALFDLHLSLIHRLEDWAVRNQITQNVINTNDVFQRGHAKNLQKKYEEIIRNFIGSSENLLQAIPSACNWDADEEESGNINDRWDCIRNSWPLLEQHLRNAAFFSVVAVWNEDQISAPQYVDSLIKWFTPLDYKLREDHHFRRSFLSPDLFKKDWNEISTYIVPFLHHPDWDRRPTPEGISRAILKNALKDTIVVVSGVVLGWFLDGNHETDLAPKTCNKLIYEAFRNTQGDQSSHYNFIIRLIRILIGEQFGRGTYASTLDGFISLFDQMAERPVIPGRVYTPSTRSRRDDLYLPWLVIWLSILPENPTPDTEKVLAFTNHEEFFPDLDNSIRNLMHDLRTLKNVLETSNRETISKGFLALKPDGNLDAATTKLTGLIDNLLTEIEQQREQRIRVRPINPARLAEIEDAACEKAFCKEAGDFPLYFFNEITFTSEILEEFTYRINEHSRGSLTIPLMDYPVGNEVSYWSETMQDGVAARVLWSAIRQAEKQEIEVLNGQAYWQAIKDFAVGKPHRHILLIRSPADPMWLHDWEWNASYREGRTPLPTDLRLWKSEYHQSQPGYEYHLNDIAVYHAPLQQGQSLLISENFFKKIEFTKFDNGKPIKATFEDAPDDPWHGTLKLTWARRVTISDEEILEIKYANPDLD